MMFLHGVYATLTTGNTIVAELDRESYMAKKRRGCDQPELLCEMERNGNEYRGV